MPAHKTAKWLRMKHSEIMESLHAFSKCYPELPYNWTCAHPHLSWRILACAGAEILDDG
jgi:hypothetical protein